MVTFYDPHPGLKGCAIPFPEHLRITAEWLDGKRMTVEEAVQCFEEAAPKEGRSVSIKARDETIMAKMGSFQEDDLPVHSWLAIRFRK